MDWARLRRTADAQCDLLTREQCLAGGMSSEALAWRVESGRWVRVQDRVYLTAKGRSDWQVRAMGALLTSAASTSAGVEGVAFRGRSAGFLWGLVPSAPDTIELIVPWERRLCQRGGIRVKRSMRWDGLVLERLDPPRTTRAATVLDLATVDDPLRALSEVARAVQKHPVTAGDLLAEMVTRGGHRHSRLLKAALSDVAAGAESAAEVLYVRDVERAHGLPVAVRQSASVLGGGRRHDNEYDAQALVVEVDGRLGHELWEDRVRDGRRDRRLLGSRRLTTRVFFADVAVTPCTTAAELAVILRERGWQGTPHRCRRRGCPLPLRSL